VVASRNKNSNFTLALFASQNSTWLNLIFYLEPSSLFTVASCNKNPNFTLVLFASQNSTWLNLIFYLEPSSLFI